MENPGQIPGVNMNVFTGEQLVKYFFSKGGDFIPKELRDKGWWPKDEEVYRCLFTMENNEPVLKYVEYEGEDIETRMKKMRLIDELCEKIRNMSLDRLIDLDIYIQRGRHSY